jgi:hypothetical protein
MENLDFGSSDVGQLIPPKTDPIVIVPDEKKDDLQQMNMTDFSSSIDDLMPPTGGLDQYSNPSSGRTTGLALPPPSEKPKKSSNPFNLSDDQYEAVIAAIVAVVVYSTSVQTKLSGMVPNFNGMNGSIDSALLIAILFYFVRKYITKK